MTTSRYLEVYSWEEMLANSDAPALDEARSMQKLGFLDCYVFTTCFHYDILEQYRDFIKNNPNKVKEYFDMFIK